MRKNIVIFYMCNNETSSLANIITIGMFIDVKGWEASYMEFPNVNKVTDIMNKLVFPSSIKY